MKIVSNAFKENIKKAGRMLKSEIRYFLNEEEVILNDNDLFSITTSTNGNILKSVMKQMDFETTYEIPTNTILSLKFGVKVNEEYEYINYGNFVVYSVEKKEETGTYYYVCYDKMLYSMKKNEELSIVYPISIRDYINALCNKIGLTFKNKEEEFANYDKVINSELYFGLEYTYRDIFDELAQVTASTICLNDNDELEIRYINETNDIIDEDYLKNVNVTFGKKYGKVNSIVLSRSAESDNVYLRDEESVVANGLCEIKIIDNQIMNFNDRDTYLPDIFGKLSGLEYFLNDFSTNGICYYEICDKYNVKIDNNMYSCIMFNNEINITQGLEENIFTEMPQETETDYTKADKTDRKINQTYLIVDKQNQKIESVISQTTAQNEKIAQVTQTVEELNSKISDIADITTSAEDTDGQVEFENINQSEPIRIVIRPIGESISYLYPNNNLYPSDTLYSKNRKIRFENITTEEIFDYELPTDLLYYDSQNYDEFILDYDGQSCVVNKRVGYNADGTTYILDNSTTLEFEYPTGDKAINLTDGNYKVYVLGYESAYLFVRLMAQNIYTTQFATKAEVSSEISQTSQSITLSVDEKLENYSTTTQMNSAIQLSASSITSSVSNTYATKTALEDTTNTLSSRIKQTANSIELTTSDNRTSAGITIKLKNEDGTEIGTDSANITLSGLVKFTDLSTSGSTTINGSNITTGSISANRISGGTINATNINVTNLNASNITRGTLNDVPIDYTSGTNNVKIFNNGDEPIMGFYNNSKRWSLASFTNGGRFQTFDGNGEMASYFNHTGAHTSSDIRYKKHIENIDKEKSLNIITNLTPITYDYNDNLYQRGLSAQEVEKVLNENGYYNQVYSIEKDRYTLNYTQLIPDLINCIKYLNEEIKKLKEENKNGKNNI